MPLRFPPFGINPLPCHLSYAPASPQPSPLLPTHSLSQRLHSTLPEPTATSTVLVEVLEVTGTSVCPEGFSGVSETVRHSDGPWTRHPCGLRCHQTQEYSVVPLPCAGLARPGQVMTGPGADLTSYPVFFSLLLLRILTT